MKLSVLAEAHYYKAKTPKTILSFVNQNGQVKDGYEMRLQPEGAPQSKAIEYVDHYIEEDEPYFVYTCYGRDDAKVLREEEFLKSVEVYEISKKRIL